MNFAEILNVIYDYRHSPDPAAVPLILSWTSKEKILQDPDTAIGWTGVITALWDRHPEKRGLWRSLHPKVIHKAHRIAFVEGICRIGELNKRQNRRGNQKRQSGITILIGDVTGGIERHEKRR